MLCEDTARLEGKVRSLENARMERVTGQDKSKKLIDPQELDAAKTAVVRLEAELQAANKELAELREAGDRAAMFQSAYNADKNAFAGSMEEMKKRLEESEQQIERLKAIVSQKEKENELLRADLKAEDRESAARR